MKKLLSVLLSISMMTSALPVNLITAAALAEESETVAEEAEIAEAESAEEAAESEKAAEEEKADEEAAEKAANEKAAEKAAEEEAERKAAEEAEKAAQEAAEEEPAAEEISDEETPAKEETLVEEETSAEETLEEETPVAEGTPAEEAPAEETYAEEETPAEETPAEEIPAEETPAEEETSEETEELLFECGYASVKEGTEVFADKALNEKAGEFTDGAVVYAEERKTGENEEDPSDDVLEVVFAAGGETVEGYLAADDAEPLTEEEADALKFALEADGVKLCDCAFEAEAQEEAEPAVLTGIVWNAEDSTLMATPGTAEEVLALPQTLTAEYSDGMTAEIAVTWVCTDEGGYLPEITGVYTFKAQADVPEGVELPEVNVVVFGAVEETAEVQEAGTVVASGECGDNATWTLDDEGTLTISGSGNTSDYNASYDENYPEWYDSYRATITKVIVEDGITELGDYLFYNLINLHKVEIADSVKSIGYCTFESCTSLTEITIPSMVASIDDGAFQKCTSLVEIEIPEKVLNIEGNTFYGCTSLTKIKISEYTKSIGYEAFYGCASLIEIILPNTVQSIGYEAFYGCTSLTEIILSNAVQSIDDDAFSACKNLKYVAIAKETSKIGNNVFKGCTSLQTLIVPFIGESNNSSSILGYFFGSTDVVLNDYYVPDSLKSVTILNQSYVKDHTFHDCSSIEEIFYPNGVKQIGIQAFAECTSLKTLFIPESYLTDIDCDAFENDTVTIVVSEKYVLRASELQDYGGKVTWQYEDGTIITADAVKQHCGDNAYWTIKDGTLTISGTGSVTENPWMIWDLNNGCYIYEEYLNRVIVENGITESSPKLCVNSFRHIMQEAA